MGKSKQMRKSARLKSSGTLEKLKEEAFLVSDGEEEIVEENDLKINSKGPLKAAQRGKGRKSPLPSDDESFQETYSDDFSESDTIVSETEGSPKKNVTSSPSGKKKLKRIGGYVPLLEQFPGINENLMSSASDWTEYIIEQNSNIKRKNRHYRTNIFEDRVDNEVPIDKIKFSPFHLINSSTEPARSSLNLFFNEESTELTSNALIVDGKVANINTETCNSFICFCECKKCKSDPKNIILFAGSNNVLKVEKLNVSKEKGILSITQIGTIMPPKAELFKSVCIYNSILSISTNRSLYFIDCKDFHDKSAFKVILNASNFAIPDIACHVWRGKHIAVGTLSGRLFIFNALLQEIFQISVTPGAAIYSLDWTDEFKVVIGGNFSKIFSIDLRTPFLIETEASTLATLPKVRWSQPLKSILFADGENHARRLENNNLHQPIGTFDSMVHEIAASPIHNIIATACASGSIHLAWMPKETGYGVEFEKKIYSLLLREDGCFESIIKPEYVNFQIHDTIKLFPSNQAATSVAWCPNENFPGLLAGGYRNGLLVLIATDRFFI